MGFQVIQKFCSPPSRANNHQFLFENTLPAKVVSQPLHQQTGARGRQQGNDKSQEINQAGYQQTMVKNAQNHEEDQGKKTRINQIANGPVGRDKQLRRIAVFTFSGKDEKPGDRQNRGGFEEWGYGRGERILRGNESDDAVHIIAQIISQNYRRKKYQEIENKKK